MNAVKRVLLLTVLMLFPSVVVGAQTAENVPVEQLEQWLAPIALYPDPLLGQVLDASMYPQQIVEADNWLQNPATAAMNRNELAAALQQTQWNPSVQSLLAFPQILHMLQVNINWTENMGQAFRTQQPDVLRAVEDLRWRAQAAGTLSSTPEQRVFTQNSHIVIQPVNPNSISVPIYNPSMVYGDWPYAEYPPSNFSNPNGAFSSFVPFAVIQPFWGWPADGHNRRLLHDRDERVSDEHHDKPQTREPTYREPGNVARQNPQPVEHGDLPNRKVRNQDSLHQDQPVYPPRPESQAEKKREPRKQETPDINLQKAAPSLPLGLRVTPSSPADGGPEEHGHEGERR